MSNMSKKLQTILMLFIFGITVALATVTGVYALSSINFGTSGGIQFGQDAYPLVLELNGGQVKGQTLTSYTYSDTVAFSLPDGNAYASKTGYTFDSWCSDEALTTKVTSIPAKTRGTKTFYAKWNANNYTLTFDANGGSVSPTSKPVTYDQAVGTLPTPTRGGYTFDAWYDNTTGGNKYTSSTIYKVADDLTLFARWNSITYNITVNPNGGKVGSHDRTYKTGASQTKTIPNPTRNGYTFTGWTVSWTDTSNHASDSLKPTISGTSTSLSIPTDCYGNITLTANWKVVDYTITYNLNSGSWKSGFKPTTKYTIESSTITLPTASNIEKVGYTFAGWFEDPSFSGSAIKNILAGSTGNKTYYAKWDINSVTVTFDYQGATGGNTEKSRQVTFNSTYGELPSPTKTGYTFEGWFTEASGGTKVTSSTTVTSSVNHIIYAHWTINQYYINLVFSVDGETTDIPNGFKVDFVVGGVTHNDLTYYYQQNDYGTKYNISAVKYNGTKISSGNYDYGYIVTFDTSEQTLGDSTGTIYVTFETKSYTITYDLDGGKATNPTSYTMKTPTFSLNAPTKDGYNFIGWTGSNGTTPEMNVTINQGSVGNKTFNANYEIITYTITYSKYSTIQGNQDTQTYTVETNLTLLTATKNYASFTGWKVYNADENPSSWVDGTTISSNALNVGTGHFGNVTMSMQYEWDKYTLIFDGNGHDINVDSVQVSYNGTLSSAGINSMPVVADEGYSFDGWYKKANGSGSKISTSTQISEAQGFVTDHENKTFTIYAKWTILKLKITFVSDGQIGGETLSSQYTNIKFGANITLPMDLKDGYVLDGWYTEQTGGTRQPDTFTMPGNSLTLYARWTSKSYTVTYDANGGTVSPSSKQMSYGKKISNPTPSIQGNGYEFMGWYYENYVTPWDGETKTPFKGSGTISDPYIIESGENLAYLSYQLETNASGVSNYEGKYFLQTKNIDLDQCEFTPIGLDYNRGFRGFYNGNNFEIYNLWIDKTGDFAITDTAYIGLFGWVGTQNVPANIVNVNLVYPTIHVDANFTSNKTVAIGPLVGSAQNGLIKSCRVYESSVYNSSIGTETPNFYIGGLVGNVTGNATIVNCYASGDMETTVGNPICGKGSSYNTNNFYNITINDTDYISSTVFKEPTLLDVSYEIRTGNYKFEDGQTFSFNADITVYAKWRKPESYLLSSWDSKILDWSSITSIEFVKEQIGENDINVGASNLGGYSLWTPNVECYGVGAYVEGTTLKIRSPYTIYAPQSSSSLFTSESSTGWQSKITSITFNNFDTSNVTSMYSMFYLCSSLTSLDLSGFDTSKVTDMSWMFGYCKGLEHIEFGSNFDTSQVTNMSNMFYICETLTNLNISSFNTSKVTRMSNMFRDCDVLTELNLSGFDTSQVKNMSMMFYSCGSLENITFSSSFITSQVTNMSNMFSLCSSLTSLDLSSFNTSQVTDMSYMFWNCDSLANITFGLNFNTSQVTNMSYMFASCSSLTSLDLSSFNTSKVTNMSDMFRYNSSLTSLDLSGFDTSQVTDMSWMFSNCSSLTSLNLSGFDTSQVTDMSAMFDGCSSLTSLNLSGFDTSKVTSMAYMFNGCSSLTSLNLSSFNTSKVTNMSYMIRYNSSLTSLDLSSFNTSQVTDMSWMFDGCSGLTSLDLSSFDMSKVTKTTKMLTGCDALTTIITPKVVETAIELPTGPWIKESDKTVLTEIPTCLLGQGAYKIIRIAVLHKNWQSKISNLTFTKIVFEKAPANGTTNLGVDTFVNQSSTFYSTITARVENGTLYIRSPFTIYAPRYSSSLFTSGSKTGWQSKITSITFNNFDTSNVTSMYRMFRDCTSLTSLDLSGFDTSKVTDMSLMFSYCSSLTSLDLSGFNTSQVKDMSYMFYYCRSLTSLDLSGFNTSQVTDMLRMFYSCDSLASIKFSSNFDTSQVTDMSNMFRECRLLTSLDLSGFNTSQVKDMSYMFYYCRSLTNLDLSSFNTSKATDMSNMFRECRLLTSLDLSSFNASQVTNMSSMFYYCSSLTSLDLSGFNTSRVTNMSWMFGYCKGLEHIEFGSNFDTSQVTNMSNMFYICETLTNLNISSFNTSKVTRMSNMFRDCDVLTELDLSGFDTSQVTDMSMMFYSCDSLENITFSSNFDTSQVTDMSSMFSHCNRLASLDLSGFDTSKVKNMSEMFQYCDSLKNITFGSNFNTSQVTDMSSMFDRCSSLTELDLSSFDTSQVTDMAFMFSVCSSLTSLDLSGFDTSQVTDMSVMFQFCESLKNITFGSNFNTSKVTDMGTMFQHCESLTSLDLSGFNTSQVTDMSSMFNQCSSLTSFDLSGFNTSQVTDMSVMFRGCSSLTSLDLSSFDMSKVTNTTYMLLDCDALITIITPKVVASDVTIALPSGKFYDFTNNRGPYTTITNANQGGVTLTKAEAKIGSTYYETLESAVSAATSEQIVEIIAPNIEVTSTMNIAENITIIGSNASTITRGSGSYSIFNITSGDVKIGTSGAMLTFDGNNVSSSKEAITIKRTSSTVTNLILGAHVTFQNFYKNTKEGSVINSTGVASWSVSMTILGAIFKNNRATNYGGVMYLSYTKLTILNGTFDGNYTTNTADEYYGGVAYIANGSSYSPSTVSGGTFTNNFAGSGGVFYVAAGKLNISSGTFSGNGIKPGTTTRTTYGGVIYSSSGTVVNIYGGTFNSNNALNGGFAYASGTFNVEASSRNNPVYIKGSSAIYSTGTLYLKNIKIIYEDYGVYYSGSSKLKIAGLIFIICSLDGHDERGLTFKNIPTQTKALVEVDGSVEIGYLMFTFGASTPTGSGTMDDSSAILIEKGGLATFTSFEDPIISEELILYTEGQSELWDEPGPYTSMNFIAEVSGQDLVTFGCFTSDTYVTVWDEKKKKLRRKKAKKVTYKDKLLVWNFDKGCFDFANPLWIQKEEVANKYTLVKFSDGSKLKVVEEHSVYSVDKKGFRPILSNNPDWGMPIGSRVFRQDGQIVSIVSKKEINKKVKFTNIFSNYHLNIFTSGIMTSTPLNNTYYIDDNMKFIYDGSKCENEALLDGISEEWIKGMRFREKSDNVLINLIKRCPGAKTLKDWVEIQKISKQKPKD